MRVVFEVWFIFNPGGNTLVTVGYGSVILFSGHRVTCQRQLESSLSRASLSPQLPRASLPSRKWMNSSFSSPSSQRRMSSNRPCRTLLLGEGLPRGGDPIQVIAWGEYDEVQSASEPKLSMLLPPGVLLMTLSASSG